MLINEKHLAELNSPVQKINARVELYNGSTLVKICTCSNYLQSFDIERAGEGKFFGYGVCNKLKINLIDISRDIDLNSFNLIEVAFGVDGDFVSPFPPFYVSEVNRDETTNEISAVAYDWLYQAASHTVSELQLTVPYTLADFVSACAALLGVNSYVFENVAVSAFNIEFANGANFDGTETIRQALNAVAEATQTIYYLNEGESLVFKRLNKEGDPVYTVNKDKYIELKTSASCTLSAICHTTELGNSVTAGDPQTGETQYIRDNPFYETFIGKDEEALAALLDNAIGVAGGLTINPFECNWIGNYLLEIGDKIGFVTEDSNEIFTYLMDDSITFDGTLGQKSKWEFAPDSAETADNPTSLGEALNKTFAKVDKVNREITLLASEVNGYSTNISELKVTTEGISASVKSIEENTNNSLDTVNDSVEKLTKEVETKMTAEDVTVQINSTFENGVDKVKTSAGFTFNDEGLHIGNSDSGIENKLDNTGMYVKSDGEEVLAANNSGVEAKNLHAKTYLVIGNNSRFEDYEEGTRTGCFWIGGN